MDIPITEVPWLEPRIAEAFSKTGISTLTDLALSPSLSVLAHGIPQEECERILDLATSSLSGAFRAKNFIQRRASPNILSTGSKALDRLMNGGFRMGALTHISGPSRTGKTQLCLQLCLSAFRAGYVSIFVDSGGTFRPERLSEISRESNLETKEVFRSVFVKRTTNATEQMEVPSRIAEIAKGTKVGLLIFDTVADNLVFEYGGERALIKRQSLLLKHLHDIALLAFKEGASVVTTGGVRERVPGGRTDVGGYIPSQIAHARIALDRTDDSISARLIEPWEGKVMIRIAKEGIRDAL